eukprot:2004155-Pleurochrysis_carterae.AAC.2
MHTDSRVPSHAGAGANGPRLHTRHGVDVHCSTCALGRTSPVVVSHASMGTTQARARAPNPNSNPNSNRNRNRNRNPCPLPPTPQP